MAAQERGCGKPLPAAALQLEDLERAFAATDNQATCDLAGREARRHNPGAP